MTNDTEDLNITHFARVKTPTILQMDAMECGAVSLSIVLAYYGLYISAEKAREACGISRDGSKAINIIKAARNLGMTADGVCVQELDGLREIKPPFIVYWQFNHFMVVEGVIKDKVYVNDPNTGPRVMLLEEFDKDFTGIVLRMTPDEDFKPGGQKEKSTLGLCYEYFKEDTWELSYIVIISVLLTLPQASLALFIQFFIDNMIVQGQRQWAPGFILIMAVTILSVGALLWIKQLFIVKYKLVFSLKKIPDFFYKLLHLPMSFYTQRASGDIANRMHIFDEIAEKITKAMSETVVSLLSILIYTLIILVISPVIGLVTMLVTLLNFVSLVITQRKIVDLGRRNSQDRAKMYSVEYSGLQMIEELKFMNGENRFFSRWLNFKSKLVASQQQIEWYTALLSLLPSTLYFFHLVLLMIFALYFVVQGSLSVGGVVAIYTLLLLFSGPVIAVVNNVLAINELKADLIRVNDILLAYKPPSKPRKKAKSKSQNLLDINDLYFGYSKLEAPILSEITINLQKGDSIAITGMSGGGKSSLLNLICGLFQPWLGEIYIKGRALKSYQPAELASIISYVDQSIFLFEGTIRDNLTMWDNTIEDEVIIEALKTACIYDTVLLKGGLDFHILEGGSNISLGQAQRLEIARALIRKPELILLDEATSALDSISEATIYENFRKIDCSFIIVAHRLSAVRHCKEIIVFEDGQISERGSHEELLALNGLYKEFLTKDYLA